MEARGASSCSGASEHMGRELAGAAEHSLQEIHEKLAGWGWLVLQSTAAGAAEYRWGLLAHVTNKS